MVRRLEKIIYFVTHVFSLNLEQKMSNLYVYY